MRLTRSLHRMTHAAAARSLAQHRAWAEWQVAQSRLVEKYVHDLLVMGRTSMEVGNAALQAMGRVVVDGLSPRTDA